jgi:hypothetical protein
MESKANTRILTLVFRLTFISYVSVFLARPYVTAEAWADIILLLFIASCGYQLAYVFYLRKKEDVRFLRSLAEFFLYLCFAVELYILLFYLVIDSGTGWEFVFYIPAFILCLIYQICFLLVGRIIKKRKQSKADTLTQNARHP